GGHGDFLQNARRESSGRRAVWIGSRSTSLTAQQEFSRDGPPWLCPPVNPSHSTNGTMLLSSTVPTAPARTRLPRRFVTSLTRSPTWNLCISLTPVLERETFARVVVVFASIQH